MLGQLSSREIRQLFLDFFAERQHAVVASSSLVPGDDPSLLFINAGMNQFKGIFLGSDSAAFSRAVTAQKCMRVSGKHNDLDTVGLSTFHHTFFEMLGNFSFGDYFKREAICMAWELLTEGYGFVPDRLWASVYEEDDEAHELWEKEVGLANERIVRLGKKDNFWAMGDTGPCGPCSELHYDYGVELGCGRPLCAPGCECGRFVELWNLVFMQFNCEADGSLVPLPAPNIDTGAGLERLTAVLQGCRSNYDTDIFRPIIDAVAGGVGGSYGTDPDDDVAFRVVADHVRALAFLLSDGVMPANEGRGYVLRRILRRAMRFGMKLGFDRPFLGVGATAVIDNMREVYGDLRRHQQLIATVLNAEEERFLQTLADGTQVFNQVVEEVRKAGSDTISGEQAFRLYDTYGLPLELTSEFASAEKLAIDEAGFQMAMEAQRLRARAARKGTPAVVAESMLRALSDNAGGNVEFLGYEALEIDEAEILFLIRDGDRAKSLREGDRGGVVCDRTPFYAESGGQVGDRGELHGVQSQAQVIDTRHVTRGVPVHEVEVVAGELRAGDRVSLSVDADRRQGARRNHTATHLLHAALRERFGEHVRQAGSLVAPDRLRFDFSHYHALSSDDIVALEEMVNEAIRSDLPVGVETVGFSSALERGAMALFGEKYGDRVRVVSVPGVSLELCAGTHVGRTGEIGTFLIQLEESVAAGTRRIEAVTANEALGALHDLRALVQQTAQVLRTQEAMVPEQVGKLVDRVQATEREIESTRMRSAVEGFAADLSQRATVVGNISVIAGRVEGLEAAGLRVLVDELKGKLGSGVVVLGTERQGKAALVVGVTCDLRERISAAELIRPLASIVGGSGGGHRELAQAGGPDASKISQALQRAPQILEELVK